MKIIFTSFDKAAITNLPRALFPGKIVVVDKPEDTRYGKEYKSERTCSVFYAGIVVSMRK